MNSSLPVEKKRRPIRSFVIRNRPWTKQQQQAFNEQGKRYLWQPQAAQSADTPSRLELQTLYPEQKPLVIEIGFGMGDSLIAELQRNSQFNYFGIEVHQPGVSRIMKAADEAEMKNIRLAMHDAVNVIDQLADGQADKIQIFFPDPWPKAKHHKRRLINPAFIELLLTKLKAEACLHIATDHIGYAEHIKLVLQKFPGLKNISSLDSNDSRLQKEIVKSSQIRPETKYERRGLRLGHPITDFIMLKM
jgi:tRNA (guanine-N7-)-methyltransferase